MYFKCCVLNCVSTRSDAVLHKFPTNDKRLNKWLECLKDDNLQRSSLKNLFVCQKHFEKKFVNPTTLKLLTTAYPTLFTQDEISSGRPFKPTDFAVCENAELDHNYSRKRHYDHSYCKEGATSTSGERVKPSSALTQDSALPHCSYQFSEMDSRAPPINEEPPLSVLRIEVQTKATEVISPPVEPSIISTPTKKLIKKECRSRILQKINKLTPTCKKIYAEYAIAKKQLNFHRRAKQAIKFAKQNAFEDTIKKLNPYGKKLIQMQINLCTKKKKGRRFTLEEKLIALAILKQGPKCYRFLHKIFILPSVSTLNKMVSNLNVEAGINKQFLNLIKKEVASWPETKKYCSILFDEMSLGMGVQYNAKNDTINGFVELNEREPRYADHVLVFMARGAVHKWQQPVAYYFCEGATSAQELKKLLKEIVPAIAETGLKPIVLGSDQGTSFQSAIKSLQQDTRRSQLLQNEKPDDTIVIGDSKLHVIFDPSHLIKGIRNNFLTKDIKYQGKISRWQDIVDVYNTDCNHTEARLLHKLNDEHVIPKKVKKMKVKNCVRVLSKTVAAALSYTSQFATYVDGTPVSSTLKNTAETVSFFDDLFDSVNGASASIKKAKGKSLRTAVREASQHHEFWLEAIEKLEGIKFLENGREKSVPTLKNFITTLKSMKSLWHFFKNNSLKIMRPRYFNTDPVENFFGQVRAYNYRNNDPTCGNFISTYKALTITRVIKFHSDSYNCEDDQAKQLVDLKSLFKNEKEEITCQVTDSLPGHSPEPGTSGTVSGTVPSTVPIESIVENARRERLNVHSRAYTTGWVIRKLFQKLPQCSRCKEGLTSNPDDTVHNWVSRREYKECVNPKKLTYPSSKAVRCFGTVLTHTNKFLEKSGYKKKLIENISSEILSKYSMDLVDCPEHQHFVNGFFTTVTIRFTIFNWCNRINKILKGTDIARLENKKLPKMQTMALEKFRKRLKNKSINK